MRAFIVAALLLNFVLGLIGSVQAQETSGDFSGGSMIVGYDGRSCDSGLEGAVRYNAIPPSGPAYCWGDDDNGQLGNGASGIDDEPNVVVTGGYNWVQISASDNETCAIDDQGDAYCWGDNSNTNLGTDSCCADAADPILVVGGHSWTQISVGLVSACGIATDGKAYCWGNDDYQQEGENASPDDGSPTVEVNESTVTGTAWTDIAAGDAISCGIRDDGTAWCWGGDYSDALGCGGACSQSYIPSQVGGAPSGSAWTNIDVAYDYGCGIRDDKTAWCWGSNGSGKLGNGNSGSGSTPIAVSGGLSFKSISTGNTHACAVTTAGDGYCWGSDSNGMLGNGGSEGNKSSPFLVTGSHTWAKIEAGYTFSCGLTTDGTAYCWGSDSDGQIGNGAATSSDRQDPEPVSGGYAWVDLTAAKTWEGLHSCGIVDEGGGGGACPIEFCAPSGGTAAPTSGLIGHWKLDETSGTDIIDYASSNDGTVQGGLDPSADSVTGKIGTALDFNRSTNDYIQTTNDYLKTADDATISAWFYPTTSVGTTPYHILWQGDSAGNGGGDEYEFSLVLGTVTWGGPNDILTFHMENDGGGDLLIEQTAVEERNRWYHVAVTMENLSSSPSVKMYLDAVQIDSDSSGSAMDRSAWNTAFRIGADGAVSREFKGYIDDVRMYDRALDAQEIDDLFYTWQPWCAGN